MARTTCTGCEFLETIAAYTGSIFRVALELELIGDVNGLVEFAPEWTSLIERCPDATVFQTPEWLIPWWRISGSGRLWALALRARGRLAGFLPMFLHRWKGRRQVTLAGNGVSDHLDLVAEPAASAECVRAIAEFLRARRADWDLCDWQDLRAGSALLELERDIFESSIEDYLPCSELALPASVDEYDQRLPHGLRRNVRRYGNRLRGEHTVQFETCAHDKSGELTEALFDLHRRRWIAKGESGMLAGHERFFAAVTKQFAAADRLRIHTLQVDGKVSGILYQLRKGDRAYGYISGFDPELERFSPGVLLLDYALRYAIADGARVWDFLRGRERYKFQWGGVEVPKFRMRVWHEPAPDHGLNDDQSPAFAGPIG